MSTKMLLLAVPALGILGLLYTWIKFNWVSKQDAGNDRMKEIIGVFPLHLLLVQFVVLLQVILE
jgi:Na+/H+-translocating membrane pyrophosphatase